VQSAADWQPNHRWTVVNYDLLGKLQAQLGAQRWAGVVVDEAHYIKNESARSRHVHRVLRSTADPSADDPEAVYPLTGTPMSNRPRDLFSLLREVRHPLAHSFFSYAKRYCAAFNNAYGLDSNGASNLEELAQLVSGVLLRRTKDEALDLPPKVRSWQPVSIPAKKVMQLEARALDYLEANPARNYPTWITFLGLLNRAPTGFQATTGRPRIASIASARRAQRSSATCTPKTRWATSSRRCSKPRHATLACSRPRPPPTRR
jgi:SWI/SNF-related matrix-associated actin-dependent regulator 1 of chromatin subfamily A